jgi:hypothetical protein
MRLNSRSSLLFGIAAYLTAVGAVVAGTPYGMRLALSKIEQPHFLVPEYRNQSLAAEFSPASEIAVHVKPYEVPNIPQASWRPSVLQSYVRSRAEAQSKTAQATPKAVAKLPTKRSKHQSRRKHDAMDAYASGRAWRPY